MYIVRNIFHTKPGKAKELVAKFKAAAPHFRELGIHNTRILTDAVAGFWTVVVESEVEDMNHYFEGLERRGPNDAVRKALDGYMELVQGGSREVFHLE